MKLINDFFTILDSSADQALFVSTIKINPSHIIFKGHFPGHPVTPGIVLLQIIHELLENHLDKKLKLLAMQHCKFLKILNPVETNQVDIKIEYEIKGDLLYIKAMGENGNDIFFKFNSIYMFN